MPYPYERLLRFFVSRKQDVNQALERYGLPSVGDIWVSNARTKIRNEAPYAIAQFVDSEEATLVAREGVLDWADGEGIGELWRLQKEFGGGPASPVLDLAFRIFMNPFSRSTMAMLLLSRMGVEEISEIFQEKYDVSVSDDVHALYTRVFWDITLMGREGWEAFLPKLKTKQERNDLALGLQPMSPEDLRDAVDVGVAIDPEHIVSRIAAKAFLQFERAMKQPNPEGDGVEMWMNAALRAAKQLHDMAPKEHNDEGNLPADGFNSLFSVQITKTTHPTLAELQGEVAQPKVPVVGEGEGEK